MYRSGQRVVTQAIQKYLGSSYDVVKTVYDNLTLLLGLQNLADNTDKVVDVADNLDDVTSVADNLTDVSAVADNIVAVTEVNDKVDDFNTKYLGSYASAPTVDGNGDPLVEGVTYWNTTLNAMFVYTGSQWVKPTGTGIVDVDTFTGDGSTASFPLDVSPASKTNTSVFIDGVYQEKDTYSVSTNLITFNTAPNDEASIEVIVNEITNFITGTQTETHTLTSGQTVVNLTNSPAFASFHIQGEDVDSQRLDLGTDYTLDLLTNTITLTNSYPENTVLKMLYGYDDDISVELAPLNQAILDHVNDTTDAHDISAIGGVADRLALSGNAVFTDTAQFATGTTKDGVLSDDTLLALVSSGTRARIQADTEYVFLNTTDKNSQGYTDGVNAFQVRDPLDVWACEKSAHPAGAIELDSGDTVQEFNNKFKSISSGLPYTDGVNFNSTDLPVSLEKNRVGANQDRWILLWGDSHSWGQGAPEYDNFSLNTNWSRHSSYPHAKGYMWQIEQHIRDKMQFAENTFYLGHPQIEGRVSPLDVRSDVLTDIECTYPVHIEGGKVEIETGNVDPSHITSNTCEEFFAPVCRTNVDSYSLTEYREKLNKGLFKNTLMILSNADVDDFIPEGFPYFMELIPDPSYPGSGGGFTAITFGSASTIVAERNNTTDVFYLVMKNREFPQWFSAGADVFIPGLGECEIVSIVGNGAVRIRYSSGSEIGSAGDSYIYPGMKIYPARVANRASLRMEMVKPARAVYVHVQHHANGGDLRICFTDSISGGAALRPYINPSVTFRQNANGWAPKLSSGGIAVHVVGPNHALGSASKAFVDSFGVLIDTSEISGGGTEEVIYRIDLGSKQIGNCYMVAQCATGESIKTRGVIFDNNKVVNVAEGAHTVGAWLGEESSNASETRDHVADILNYCPIRPSHVITQIPFVNEYIKQTPITTFKTRLATFVTRHTNHMASSNNYNNVGVDFMFFTSLRERENLFEGVPEASIKYSDYVNAAREFCEDNGHAFVDCEAELIRLVESGRIDYERLFNNNAHPSDFANRAIFEVLRRDYLDFIC